MSQLKIIIQILILIFFSFSALASAYTGLAAEDTIPNFSGTPLSGVAPLTVHFNQIGNENSTTIRWDFGDGTYSTTKNPTHTYNKTGIYTVKLTVDDQNETKSNYIVVTSPPIPPVSAFSASSISGNAPLTVTFTDKSTGSPASWLWNFGDGATSIEKSPTHIFYRDSTFTVSLTVSNAAGSSVSSSLINVSSASAVVVDFNSNVFSGKAPLTVQFNDLSTGNPTTWNWDFGDGTNSTTKNPTHTYLATGTYTVTLRAGSGTAWGSATKTNYIIAGNGLQAVFTASPSQGEAPLNVQFTDASIGAPTAWLWDFGDGTNSTLQSPAHIFNLAGNYTVKLTVSNNIDSNTSAIPSIINVSSVISQFVNTPVASFNSNVTSGKCSSPCSVHRYIYR